MTLFLLIYTEISNIS